MASPLKTVSKEGWTMVNEVMEAILAHLEGVPDSAGAQEPHK